MKAQNLTISIPYKGCDKNCPYCVSKMTGYVITDEYLIKKNISKVKKLAEIAGVNSVLLTGKGEPFLNMEWIEYFTEHFSDYPLEIQTNGIILSKDSDAINKISKSSINTIAFSLDKIEQFKELTPTFNKIREKGLIVRVTLNLTSMIPTDITFDMMIDLCIESSVDQFSIRNVTAPNYIPEKNKKSNDTVEWILKNTDNTQYPKIITEIESKVNHLIRVLPFGAKVYDYRGIAITYFDYCVQDNHSDDDMRSLIFLEDGHLYTSWNSRASILF